MHPLIEVLKAQMADQAKRLTAMEAQLKDASAQLKAERDAKDAQLKDASAQLKAERDAKDAQLKEAAAQLKAERDAKDAQLKAERDAKDRLQEERLILWQKRQMLERERMTALAALGKIDLRRVLESIFPAGARNDAAFQAYVENNDAFLTRCQGEPKIHADFCKPKTRQVTANVIANELRRIWDDLHSDVHFQLTVEEWQTCRPGQRVVLKVNGITQSRVLLLYHLLDCYGYPVDAEGVVPRVSP